MQTASAGGGTRATVTTLPVAYTPAFVAPSGASANIPAASTNIELANEIIQQIMARYGFAANSQVMKADARLMAAFLDITA
jgi:flagellar basal-body rod protein FlgC